MRLRHDWKRILRYSFTVWLSGLSQLFFVLAGAVYVFAEELGDWLYFGLVGGLGGLGFLCLAVVPLARIIHQPKLNDES